MMKTTKINITYHHINDDGELLWDMIEYGKRLSTVPVEKFGFELNDKFIGYILRIIRSRELEDLLDKVDSKLEKMINILEGHDNSL